MEDDKMERACERIQSTDVLIIDEVYDQPLTFMILSYNFSKGDNFMCKPLTQTRFDIMS